MPRRPLLDDFGTFFAVPTASASSELLDGTAESKRATRRNRTGDLLITKPIVVCPWSRVQYAAVHGDCWGVH